MSLKAHCSPVMHCEPRAVLSDLRNCKLSELLEVIFKELRHDILGHFFDGVSHGSSVGKPKTNDLLMKEKTKGVILKQKGTRMADDEED